MNETTNNGDTPQIETKTDTASDNDTTNVDTMSESIAPLPELTPEVTAPLLSQPLKSLRERGISAQTKEHFDIKDFLGRGLCYKTESLDGKAGPPRFKGMVAGAARYKWVGQEVPDQLPLLYNSAVLKDTERLKQGVFLVQDEAEVWPMYQSGLAAVALFDVGGEQSPDQPPSDPSPSDPSPSDPSPSDPSPSDPSSPDQSLPNQPSPNQPLPISSAALEELAETMRKRRQPVLNLLFDHDARGRLWAINVLKTLRDLGIGCQMLALQSWPDAPLGFSVSELFEAVGFDSVRMRDAVAMLQIVTPHQVKCWEEDPTLDLPAAIKPEDKLLPCLDEDALESLPDVSFLVDGLILASSVTLMTSKENLGKSAIAIALAATVSLGIPWQGQATTPGLAFYLAAEGQGGIRKRLQACKQSLGVASTPHFLTLPISLHLSDTKARERLIQTIEYATAKAREEALRNGVEPPAPALLVIDTLAKTRGTLDENSPNDMTLYLEAAAEICKRTSVSTLILHHNNRNEAFRGSSALTANADAHLMLIDEAEQVVLKVAKMKDFPDGQQYVLRKRVIDLGVGKDGKARNSVVFERDLQAEAKRQESGGSGEAEGLSPKAKTSLRVLARLCAANNGGGIASSEWFKSALQQGVSKPTFDRAKRALLAEGALICENAGTPNARFAPNPEYKP